MIETTTSDTLINEFYDLQGKYHFIGAADTEPCDVLWEICEAADKLKEYKWSDLNANTWGLFTLDAQIEGVTPEDVADQLTRKAKEVYLFIVLEQQEKCKNLIRSLFTLDS